MYLGLGVGKHHLRDLGSVVVQEMDGDFLGKLCRLFVQFQRKSFQGILVALLFGIANNFRQVAGEALILLYSHGCLQQAYHGTVFRLGSFLSGTAGVEGVQELSDSLVVHTACGFYIGGFDLFHKGFQRFSGKYGRNVHGSELLQNCQIHLNHLVPVGRGFGDDQVVFVLVEIIGENIGDHAGAVPVGSEGELIGCFPKGDDLLHLVLRLLGGFRLGNGVPCAGNDDNSGQQQRDDGQPHAGLLPVQGVLDTGLGGSTLGEGNGSGRGELLVGGEVKKSLGIALLHVFGAVSRQNCLVTAQFHIQTHAVEGDPTQGVEPMEGKNTEGDGLHYVVKPLQMVILVGKNVFFCRIAHAEGDINAGLDNA